MSKKLQGNFKLVKLRCLFWGIVRFCTLFGSKVMIRNQNEFDYNYLTEFIASVRAGHWRCQKTTRKPRDQTRQIASSSKTTRMRALKFFLVKLDEKLI